MDNYLMTRTSTWVEPGQGLLPAGHVVLKSPAGEVLAECLATDRDDAGRLPLERVLQGKGNLLGYYFGRGARAVIVEFGTFRLHGYLETAWAGAERRWDVLLKPAPVGPSK